MKLKTGDPLADSISTSRGQQAVFCFNTLSFHNFQNTLPDFIASRILPFSGYFADFTAIVQTISEKRLTLTDFYIV